MASTVTDRLGGSSAASVATDRLSGFSSGAAIKVPVKAATTANITLSGEQTIDGVAVVTDDRVLVKDQTTASQNGIYIASTGTWSRAKDFDGGRDAVKGTLVMVTDGTVNGDTAWRVSTADGFTIGSSSLNFENAVNQLNGVSAFIETVLDDANADTAQTTLGGTTVGKAVFTAASAAAARTTLDTFEDVFTTRGDLLRAGASGAEERLALGTSGQVLRSNGTDAAWAAIAASDLPTGSRIQTVSTQTGAAATGTTAIPNDDTIPQNTEGDEYMTLAVTPTNASNILQIDVVVNLSSTNTSALLIAALFQDTTADAIAAGWGGRTSATTAPTQIIFRHRMTAGTTSSTTFKVRAGAIGAGTTTFNGQSGARVFGGVMASSITITEIKA